MKDKNQYEKLKGGIQERSMIYETVSEFQDIYVVEQNEFEGVQGKYRLLQFNFDTVQGVMNIEKPKDLVSLYCRITVDLIEHYAANFINGFIIGHGIGTISSYYSDKHIVTAEIDPLVVEVSKKYFGHTCKNVKIGDGLEILETLEDKSQDVIFLDAYSDSGVPHHLTSSEFFSATNQKLSEDGILIMNYIGKVKNDKIFHMLYSNISESYPYVRLFVSNPKKKSKQNIILLASQKFLDDYSPHEATPFIMGK